MADQPYHDMLLDKRHPAGPEEWLCPICGRRIILQWPPNYKKMVLVVGDENATHAGTKGGLEFEHNNELASVSHEYGEENAPEVKDEEITEFKDWIDENPDLWQKPLT